MAKPVNTKLGLRGDREIARGIFVASVLAFALGLALLVRHVSIVAIVVGVLLMVAGVAVVVRYSTKRIV